MSRRDNNAHLRREENEMNNSGNNNQANQQLLPRSNDENKSSSKSSSEQYTKEDCSKNPSTTITTTSNSARNTHTTTATQQNERESSTTYATYTHTESHRDTFPHKLHRLLANDTISDIVSWLPHGKSWIIYKQLEFEDEVLPRYFGNTKMSTFVRQVTGWGFRRITFKGPDYKSYYHAMFKRDDDEYKGMKRPVKDKSSKEDPPNFYDLPGPEDTSSSSTSAQVGKSQQEQQLSFLNLPQDQLLQLQGQQDLGLQGCMSLASGRNDEALLNQHNQLLNATIASNFALQQYGLTGLSLAQQQQVLLDLQNLQHQLNAIISRSSGADLQRQYASFVDQPRTYPNSQLPLAQQLANRQIDTSNLTLSEEKSDDGRRREYLQYDCVVLISSLHRLPSLFALLTMNFPRVLGIFNLSSAKQRRITETWWNNNLVFISLMKTLRPDNVLGAV